MGAIRARIVLVSPEIPENVGFIAREMLNFEFRELYLVSPAFKDFNRAYRTAVHADSILKNAVITDSIEAAVEGTDLIIGTTSKRGGKRNLIRKTIDLNHFLEVLHPRKYLAILFGRESIGLKNSELEKCDLVVKIPSSDDYPCLNLSIAAGIIMYELYLKARPSKMQVLASKESLNVLFSYMQKVIDKLNIPSFKKERLLRILKDTVNRSTATGLEEGEVKDLITLFRKIYLSMEGT